MQYGDGIYLEKIDFTPQNYEDTLDFQFCIDRKQWLTESTYNVQENTSTFTKPYKNVNPLTALDVKGFPLETAEETETTITVYGNYTKVCVGNCYESYFELPTIYYRTQTQSGTSKVQEGILMLRDISLTYNNTGFFKVLVQQKYTSSITSEFVFSGVILGTETSQLNKMPVSDGVFLIPVIARNEDIDTIKIINDSHLPSCFTTLDWLGDFVIRGRN